MTPQSLAMIEAGHDGIGLRAQPWNVTEKGFFSDVERVRALYAQLIDAEPDDIAMSPAASYGIGIAANNIKLNKGQQILVVEDQFPSNIYSWRRMADEQQLKFNIVARPQNGDWTSAVLEQLATHGDSIGLLALPQVHWTDGGVLDLKKISKQSKAIGAFLVLDLTQSVGAMPFSVKEIDADYVAVAGYKWLFSPYSTGFLYVAPRHHDGVPLEENWINRKGSENFAGLVNYQDEYAAGARRFDVGERANFSLMPQVEQSIKQILAWGVENIAETLKEKNKTISAIFENAGFTSCYSPDNSAHILGMETKHQIPANFAETLKNEGVRLSIRSSALRIAPHIYNDDEDMAGLKTALDKALRPS
jgi:selenocysteine lyase/cysteine desulfurase